MSKCCDNLSDNRRKQTKQNGKARAKENCGCIFCDLDLLAGIWSTCHTWKSCSVLQMLMNFAPIHQANRLLTGHACKGFHCTYQA